MNNKDSHTPNEKKSFQEKQKEEWVSQWIDDLNRDQKPKEDALENSNISEEEKRELHEVLDTLRRVKSLRSVDDQEEKEAVTGGGKKFPLRKRGWIVAAVLLLALITSISSMFMGSNGNSVVYAMEEALENLRNYKGTISFTMEMSDQVMQESNTELTVGENQGFRSVTQVAGREITRIYPGEDRMYTLFSDRENYVEVSHIGEESLSFYQEIFLMESILEEIQDAVEIIEMGKESLNGRETTKYHYRYHEDAPYHELWVDESTDLPIKVAHHSEYGDRMVRTMENLELNVSDISEDLFTYEIPENAEVHYTSPEAEE